MSNDEINDSTILACTVRPIFADGSDPSMYMAKSKNVHSVHAADSLFDDPSGDLKSTLSGH